VTNGRNRFKERDMSNIKIESASGWAKVWVDGVELRQLTGIAVNFPVGQIPEVAVSMAAFTGDLTMADGTLKINGLEMPEALEKALLDFLCAKYPMQSMVKRSTGGLFALVQQGEAVLPRAEV